MFCEVARHQINTQKYLAFLYSDEEISERRIKETNLVYQHTKTSRNKPT